MSTLTNDLSRLANSANVLVSAIAVNSSAITSVNVSGLIINSSGLGGPVSFSNNVTITGNLVVTGSTVTVNTTTLDVKDLNITVAKGAGSAAAANGAGLTVDAGYANLYYDSTANSWTSTVGLNIASGNLYFGTASNTARLILTTPSGDGTVTLSGDGTNFGTYRSVGASYFQLGSTTAVPLWLITNNANRLLVAANGNIGIGNTAPTDALSVTGTGFFSSDLKTNGELQSNGTILGIVRLYVAGTEKGKVSANSSGSLLFDTVGSQRACIDSSGNFGVGVTTVQGSSGTKTIEASGCLITGGPLAAHQTSRGIFEFNANKVALRAYGNTAGSGYLGFNVGGGGGSPDLEAVRINPNGDTQFGVTATAAGGLRYLDIYNTESSNTGSGAIIRLVTANSTGGAAVTLDMVKYRFGQFTLNNNDANGFITFNTAGSERVRIDNSGNFGIGTTSPTGRLSIVGGSLPTAGSGNGLTLSSGLGATRLTTDASNQTSFIGGYYDSNALEISQGSTSGYTSGIVISSRSATNATVADAIALYTRSAERVRIDNSGNVGIGTSSPQSRLHVANEIRIGRTDASSEGGEIKLCRSIDDVAAYSIDVNGNTTNPEFRIFNPIAGTVFFAASNTGVRYIKFDPTAANIGDANCLDDYEEGTWTPTIGGTTATYYVQSGSYVKIGRMVFLTLDISINLRGNGSTQFVTGLPFAWNGGGVVRSAGSLTYFNNMNVSGTSFYPSIDVQGIYVNYTSAASAAVVDAPAWIKDGTRIICSISYQTTT